MTEDMHDLPFQAVQFIAACEKVMFLPFQNGEEDWALFQSMLKQLNDNNIDIELFVGSRPSSKLAKSPLFEILLGGASRIKPPVTLSTVKSRLPFVRRRMNQLKFTTKEFIDLCVETNHKCNIDWDNLKSHISHFKSMTYALVQGQVNILEFLSSEMTDELLEECPFFRLIIHTARAERSHVFIDWVALYNALETRQGFTLDSRRMHVPPYPPSQYGLTFDHKHLMQLLQDAEVDVQGLQAINFHMQASPAGFNPQGWQAAEFDLQVATAAVDLQATAANMDEFSAEQYDHIESFDILHGWCHQLSGKHISLFAFMGDREPANGTLGSTIYKYLINAATPPEHPHPGEIDCFLFFANVASNGNGHVLIAAIENELNSRTRPSFLTRDQAVAFADARPKIDVVTIPRDSIRCMHCWANFDEVEDGVNNEPLQLPCDSRHILGRDCLIEVLTCTGPLCPLCRVDMVAKVSDVS